MRPLRGLVALASVASLIAGCAWYQVGPGVYVPGPAPVVPGPPPGPVVAAPTTFDRSWAAARNAMLDQGVRVTQEDRGTGTIRGSKSGIDVISLVHAQADGSVRVEFKTIGATAVDPQLIEAISASYDRHMGR